MHSPRVQTWRRSRLLLASQALALVGILAHSLPDTTRQSLAALAASLMAGPTDLRLAELLPRAALEPQAVRCDGQL